MIVYFVQPCMWKFFPTLRETDIKTHALVVAVQNWFLSCAWQLMYYLMLKCGQAFGMHWRLRNDAI